MKADKYFILIFIVLFLEISAQNNDEKKITYKAICDSCLIKGRITEAGTDNPLPMVNVYLSGTTIGASTDEEGYFIIEKIPTIQVKVVISSIGYETKLFDVDFRNEKKVLLNISLDKNLYELDPITITSRVSPTWKNQLAFFKKLFMGKSEFASECSITNEFYLEFFDSEALFTANCPIPLNIINKALGYRIEVVLKSFEYDKIHRTLKYLVYPRFQGISVSDEDSVSIFNENRTYAYNGSTMHLLRMLSHDEFAFSEEGFEISYMYKKHSLGEVISSTEIVSIDSLSNQHFLNPASGSLLRFGFKCDGLKIEFNDSQKNEISYVYMTRETGAEYDPNGGFIFPTEFIIYGDLSNYGFADMLPIDWQIEVD